MSSKNDICQFTWHLRAKAITCRLSTFGGLPQCDTWKREFGRSGSLTFPPLVWYDVMSHHWCGVLVTHFSSLGTLWWKWKLNPEMYTSRFSSSSKSSWIGWLFDTLSQRLSQLSLLFVCCGIVCKSHLRQADRHDSLPEVKVMLEFEERQVRVGEVARVHSHLPMFSPSGQIQC